MDSFAEKCYALLSQVPEWRVTTYREIAHALWNKAYRAVGTAMNKNPYAPKIPCHRVVNTSWDLGWFAFWDQEKINILNKEWISLSRKKNWKWKVDNFQDILFQSKDFLV